MYERRTFVVTVRSADALTVEDVVRRDIEALPGLDDLPAWIEHRLRGEPHPETDESQLDGRGS